MLSVDNILITRQAEIFNVSPSSREKPESTAGPAFGLEAGFSITAIIIAIINNNYKKFSFPVLQLSPPEKPKALGSSQMREHSARFIILQYPSHSSLKKS